MENIDKTIIEIRIKLLRDIHGLTQEELAKNLNVSRALINCWENGYTDISLNKLVLLSYYFKVPIDYILGLINEFNQKNYTFKQSIDKTYLGKNIRLIRKTNRLNQIEFAKIVHMERSTLSHYENGKATMSSSDLKEICSTFGFSADWCLGSTNHSLLNSKNRFHELINT